MNAEAVARHAAEVDEQGYTVVADAIEPGLVDALLQEVERLERELVPIAENSATVVKGRPRPSLPPVEVTEHDWVRIDDLLLHSALFEHVPVQPSVLPIVEEVLGPGCLISWLMTSTQTPGAVAQRVHADDEMYPLPRPHPPLLCNSLWALVDFTVANGATRVVPGSHRWREMPAPPFPDGEPIEMPKGSVLIWNGSLWHTAGANTSNERRPAITMNYCAGFLRQQVNQQLGLPRSLVQTFEPRLQELVGYGTFAGKMGRISWQSPAVYIDEEDDVLGDILALRNTGEATALRAVTASA